MTTDTDFIFSLATVVPAAVGAFVFFTLAALILGARLVRDREDGGTSFFSFDVASGDSDGGCGGGCGD